jgi:hypothetical protein
MFSLYSLPELHISFLEVGKKETSNIHALVRIQKYHIYISDLRVLQEGEGKLCFTFKTYAKTPIDLTEGSR